MSYTWNPEPEDPARFEPEHDENAWRGDLHEADDDTWRGTDDAECAECDEVFEADAEWPEDMAGPEYWMYRDMDDDE